MTPTWVIPPYKLIILNWLILLTKKIKIETNLINRLNHAYSHIDGKTELIKLF